MADPTPYPNSGNSGSTTKGSNKLQSGKKHVLDPKDLILIGKSMKGFVPFMCYFQIDKPIWIAGGTDPDPYNDIENDKIELDESKHLNASKTKLNDLKKWCLMHLDSNKFFKSIHDITIIGHTSADGGDLHNQKLSRRRAKAIENWIKKRFPHTKFSWHVDWLGEMDANQSTKNEKIRELERRVDIDVYVYLQDAMLRAHYIKKEEPPVVELWFNLQKHIVVQKDPADQSKITTTFSFPQIKYEEAPGIVLDYALKLIAIYEKDFAGPVDKEVQQLKEFLQMKRDKRYNTPL